jgi:hypothetical protein
MVTDNATRAKLVVMKRLPEVPCVASNRDKQKKIAWLAAMLECEGTFTFQYNEQIKEGRLHSHIQPRIIFVNSDFAMVDAVAKTFRNLGFEPYERPGTHAPGIGKKPMREIQYNGFKSLPLIKLLRPEMVGAKIEVVDCMIAFIEYRQGLKQPKQKYGDYEFELLRRVREINSGQWNNKPKFALISTEAVKERREAVDTA